MVAAIDHEPGEGEFVLITGCIARNLKDRPSFSGAYNPELHTNEQKFELTKAVAQVMATRMKGTNLATEHAEENGPIGEIIHTWIDDAKNEWHIQAIVDRNSRAGMDAIQALLAEHDDESPYGVRIGELSLGTQGFDVRETSLVIKGARPGSTIDKVELINKAQLEAIKNQEYKPIATYIPDHIPEGAPRICATFSHAMSTNSYHAIKNAPAPATYQSLQNVPAETTPINNQIEQMKQHQLAIKAQEQNSFLAQQAREQQTQQMQMQIDALQKQMAANQQTALQTPQIFPGDPQLQALHNKLSNPQPGAPHEGNVHTMYTNPADDPLVSMARVLQSGSNVLSNQQKQDLMAKLMAAAQHTKQTKDAALSAESQLNLLKQKNLELEQKVQKHEGDKTQQQKQTANILKRLLMKTNPPLNQNEQKDLDTAEQTMAAGQMERGMEIATPFIIRASAFLDAAEQSAQAQTGTQQVNIVEQMQRILNPGQLTQASGYGQQVAGRKRGYEDMHAGGMYGANVPGASAAAFGGSTGMWSTEKYGDLASIFAKAEGLDDGTFRLQDVKG